MRRMGWNRMTGLVVAAGLLAALAACQSRPQKDVVAVVNNEPITRQELERALALSGGGDKPDPAVINYLLEELVDRLLILQRARELGLTVGADELRRAEEEIRDEYGPEGFSTLMVTQAVDLEEWRRELAKKLLVGKVLLAEVPQVSAESGEAAPPEENDAPDQERVRVRQVLAETKENAEAAQRELRNGKPFEDVARKYSSLQDSLGADIDYFGRGEMPPELEKAIWKLKPGQVSAVIKSEYGWHVFVLVDRIFQASTSDALRRERRLARQAARQEAWLDELRKKAKIVLHPEHLKESSR